MVIFPVIGHFAQHFVAVQLYSVFGLKSGKNPGKNVTQTVSKVGVSIAL